MRKLSTFFRSHPKEVSVCAVLLLLIICGAVSFAAGRRSAQKDTVSVVLQKEEMPEQTGPATPSFLFKPYATASQAEYADAAIAQPDQLSLAYVYPDGADTSQVSESLAGLLYRELAERDARWISGIYDLYNYTPEQAAAFLGPEIHGFQGGASVPQEFKEASIQFYDGSGPASQGYSNARSITAMCSVLYDYGILREQEELERYSRLLWDASHSYEAEMSDVYYCDGSCRLMGEGASEEPDEFSDAEKAASEERTSAGDEAAEAGSGSIASDGGDELEAAAGETEDDADEQEGILRAARPNTDGVRGPGAESGSEDAASQASPSSAGDSLDAASASQAGRAREEGCQGHVDLTISVTILGTEGESNLFQAVLLDSAEEDGPGWEWDSERMGLIEAILEQDWYEVYGLNAADLIAYNPLSAADIDVYMQLVPQEAEQQRRDIVRYALASVGKIPYYWGGKPSRPGYTGNDFGAVVQPDIDGRILKGLDCSGWINWVYWSVTGRSPGASSTSTLLAAGQAVSRDELLPGDICIRTGPEAHVVMFLGWYEDGRMVCIQETSGTVNNVEVALVTPDWAAYRRLLDEEV